MTDWAIKTLAEEIWAQLKNQIPNNPVEYIIIGLTIAAKAGYKKD